MNGFGGRRVDNCNQIKGFIESELLRGGVRSGVEIDEDLIESGVIDSMGIQKLLAFLENRWGVQIPDEDVIPEHFESVMAVAAYLGTKTPGRR